MKHFLLSIILFLFLSSSYASATHIHDYDSNHQDNCDICIVINSLHSGDLSSISVTIDSIEYAYENIRFYQHLFIQQILKGFNSTAPPSF